MPYQYRRETTVPTCSPICTDPLLLGQASQGGDISTDYCTIVAQSNLVSTIVEQSGGHPNPLATNPRYCDKPHGQNHPLATQGHLPLAAWPVSGDPSMQEDYQKELWISSRSHGDSQRSQHTPVLRDNGIVGVLSKKLIQLQPL